MSTPRRLAATFALALGGTTFLGVAPFSCDADGWCHGLVAFDYGPSSAGVWQALAAAAFVALVTWVLVWLAASPRGTTPLGARVVVSLLLLAGAGISVMSQSVLLVAGPVVAGLFLWLMWRPNREGPKPAV